ncbi:ATP phosphoribosyltransferase regulatory subunit [Pontivivens insulae]|uniref:ATP phosphoribosyltransferase regulatory subunit n=1 Tax=Pontivivens insulae TaxID=1639689 RepID=A0A2R8A7D3_9RHOB|nr:ATP phosphoribosyltransferase regulatory subunit [Pontivivens insulae]RED18245.1 ATP phosphoribosyltransferase regulatory subunit [Pontivivens insulae]SPF28143.1 ATP phosphoribosyltransferase regulatory subunit [Pontivivens insulae]
MIAARAYMPDGRIGTGLERLEVEVSRLMALFAEAGAQKVEPGALLDADVLLDLYGEDIRGRAYVTQDPVLGERMLRPDFTVPVTQMHAAHGAEPARYAYAGPVWRRQEPGSGRPTEYLQVGFEIFDASDAARVDAEVFALFSAALAGQGLAVETGDLGVLFAAIDALDIDARRAGMLRRHVWRPKRFRRVLDTFSNTTRRAALLDQTVEDWRAAALTASPQNGIRSVDEVIARLSDLAAERELPELSGEQRQMLQQVLDTKGSLFSALTELTELSHNFPPLAKAAQRLEARIAALDAAGLDGGALPFAASFGRTTMEYYDGFVFGFVDRERPDLPPVASGGRYDALTAALGPAIPAVGGIIRPEALLSRKAAS